MAYTILCVDPQGYADAAVKARQALAEIETAVHAALRALATTAHMGGNDEAGGKFAHAYDANAKNVLQGLSGLCTALSATSSTLDASAASHAAAESANAAGVLGSGAAASAAPAAPVTLSFADPASAYGGTNIFPQGWTFIQDLVSGTWPDGDTDRMHSATTHWNDLADDIDSARSRHLVSLLDPLAGFQAPDIAAIETATKPLGDGAKELADACRQIADQCSEYAKLVVETHAAAGNELAEFVATSIAALGISAILTPFTAGISDLVGGGAVAAKAIETAGEISETLATLTTRVAALLARISEISETSGAVGRIAFNGLGKLSVFAAKSAYTGTIWGVSSAGTDLYVNGPRADVGRDFATAYIGGAVGRGFDEAGEALAAGARNRIGDGLSSTCKVAAVASAGPKHAFSPAAMAASNGINGTFRIGGVSGGAVASQYLLGSGHVDGGEAAKDALKDLLTPSIDAKSAPKHLAEPRPIAPAIEPAG